MKIKATRCYQPLKKKKKKKTDANQLIETYGCKILSSTFVNDAAKMWNNAPEDIKSSNSVYSAKKNIKNTVLVYPFKFHLNSHHCFLIDKSLVLKRNKLLLLLLLRAGS